MVKFSKLFHQTHWFEIFVLVSNSLLFYLGRAKGEEFLISNHHYFILSVLALTVLPCLSFLSFLTDKIYKYKMEKLKYTYKEKLPKKNNEMRKINPETESIQKLNQV